ncbi:MAG: hypothetical protein NVSMB51_06510 [Solirubrobacteraceae bacterium]
MQRPDPGRAATRAFVRAVGRARAQGTPPPAGLRRRIVLGTIFRVMPRQVDRRRAARVRGVVEWRIRDEKDGVDIWTTRFEDGRCTVRRGGAARPRTKIEVGTGDFFALATGNANGAELLFEGRLKIEGDLWFAAKLAGVFRVPRRR